MSSTENDTAVKGRSKDGSVPPNSSLDTNIWDQVFEPEAIGSPGLGTVKDPDETLDKGSDDSPHQRPKPDGTFGDTAHKEKDGEKQEDVDKESDHSWLVSQLYGDEDGEGEVGDSVRAQSATEGEAEPGELVKNQNNEVNLSPGAIPQGLQRSGGCPGGPPVAIDGQHHGHSKEGQTVVAQMSSGHHADHTNWWNQWPGHAQWAGGWQGVVTPAMYSGTAGPEGLQAYSGTWGPDYNRPHGSQYWRHGREDERTGSWGDRRYDSRRTRRYKSRSPDRDRWEHRRRESERDRKKESERSSREKDRDRRNARGEDRSRASSGNSRSRSYTSDRRRENSRSDYNKDRKGRDSYKDDRQIRDRHSDRYSSRLEDRDRRGRERERSSQESKDRRDSRSRKETREQRDRGRLYKPREGGRYEHASLERSEDERLDKNETNVKSSKTGSRGSPKSRDADHSLRDTEERNNENEKETNVEEGLSKEVVSVDPSAEVGSIQEKSAGKVTKKRSAKASTKGSQAASDSDSDSDSDSSSSDSSSGSSSSSNSGSSSGSGSNSDSSSSSSSSSEDEGEKEVEGLIEGTEEEERCNDGRNGDIVASEPQGDKRETELANDKAFKTSRLADKKEEEEERSDPSENTKKDPASLKQGVVSETIMEKTVVHTAKRNSDQMFSKGLQIPRQVSIKEKIKIKLKPRPLKLHLIKPVELVPCDDLTTEAVRPEPNSKEDMPPVEKNEVKEEQLKDGNPTFLKEKNDGRKDEGEVESADLGLGISLNSKEQTDTHSDTEFSESKPTQDPVNFDDSTSLILCPQKRIESENYEERIEDIPIPGFESAQPSVSEDVKEGSFLNLFSDKKQGSEDNVNRANRASQAHLVKDVNTVETKVAVPDESIVGTHTKEGDELGSDKIKQSEEMRKSPDANAELENKACLPSGDSLPMGDMISKLLCFHENGATVKINGAVEKVSGDGDVFQIRDKVSGSIVKITDVTTKSRGETPKEKLGEGKLTDENHLLKKEDGVEGKEEVEAYSPERVVDYSVEKSICSESDEYLSVTNPPVPTKSIVDKICDQQIQESVGDSRVKAEPTQVSPREPMDLPMPAFAKFYGYSPKKTSCEPPQTTSPPQHGVVREEKGRNEEEFGKSLKGHIRSPNEAWQNMRALRTLDMGNTPNGGSHIINISSTRLSGGTSPSVRDPRLAHREQHTNSNNSDNNNNNRDISHSPTAKLLTPSHGSGASSAGVHNIFEILRGSLNTQSKEDHTNESPDNCSENKRPATNAFFPKPSISESLNVTSDKKTKQGLSPQNKNKKVVTKDSPQTENEPCSDSFKPRKHAKWSQWKASHSMGELYKGNSNGLTVLPQGNTVDQSLLPEAKLLRSMETKRKNQKNDNKVKIGAKKPKMDVEDLDICKAIAGETKFEGNHGEGATLKGNMLRDVAKSGSLSNQSSNKPQTSGSCGEPNPSKENPAEDTTLKSAGTCLGMKSAAMLHELIAQYCEPPVSTNNYDASQHRVSKSAHSDKPNPIVHNDKSDFSGQVLNGFTEVHHDRSKVNDDEDKSVHSSSVNEEVDISSKEVIIEKSSSLGQCSESNPGDYVTEPMNEEHSDGSVSSHQLNETLSSSHIEGNDHSCGLSSNIEGKDGLDDQSYGISSSNPGGKESCGQESQSSASCDHDGFDPEQEECPMMEEEADNSENDDMKNRMENSRPCDISEDNFLQFEPLKSSVEPYPKEVSESKPFESFSRSDWEALLTCKVKGLICDRKLKASHKKKESKPVESVSGSSSCDTSSSNNSSNSSSGGSSSGSSSVSHEHSQSDSNKNNSFNSVANAISSRSPISQMNLSTPRQCLPQSPKAGKESLSNENDGEVSECRESASSQTNSSQSRERSNESSEKSMNSPSYKSNSDIHSNESISQEDDGSEQKDFCNKSEGSLGEGDEKAQLRRIFGTDSEDSEEENQEIQRDVYNSQYERKPLYHPTVAQIESDLDKESKTSSIKDNQSLGSVENKMEWGPGGHDTDGKDADELDQQKDVLEEAQNNSVLVDTVLNLDDIREPYGEELPEYKSDNTVDLSDVENNEEDEQGSYRSGTEVCLEDAIAYCNREDSESENENSATEASLSVKEADRDGNNVMTVATETVSRQDYGSASPKAHFDIDDSVVTGVQSKSSLDGPSKGDVEEEKGVLGPDISYSMGNMREGAGRMGSNDKNSHSAHRVYLKELKMKIELNNNNKTETSQCINEKPNDLGAPTGAGIEFTKGVNQKETRKTPQCSNTAAVVNISQVNPSTNTERVIDCNPFPQEELCDKLDSKTASISVVLERRETKKLTFIKHRIAELGADDKVDCDNTDELNSLSAGQPRKLLVDKLNVHRVLNDSKTIPTKRSISRVADDIGLIPPGTTPPRLIEEHGDSYSPMMAPRIVPNLRGLRKREVAEIGCDAPPGTEIVTLPKRDPNLCRTVVRKAPSLTKDEIILHADKNDHIKNIPLMVGGAISIRRPEVLLRSPSGIQWKPRYRTESDSSGDGVSDKPRSSHSKSRARETSKGSSKGRYKSENKSHRRRGKRSSERYRGRRRGESRGKSHSRRSRKRRRYRRRRSRSSTCESSSSSSSSSSESSYKRGRKWEASENRRKKRSRSTSVESGRGNEGKNQGKPKKSCRKENCCFEKKNLRDHDIHDFFYRRALAGYCFVEFPSQEAAHHAMLRLSGKVVPASNPPKRFKLNHASYGKEHLLVPEYSIFVGDLSEDVDDLELFQAFSKRYPSCRAAKVVHDNDCRSRGYGFVRFTSEEEQQRALAEMQNSTGIGSKPIRVSPATPKRPSYPGGPPPHMNYHDNYWNQGYWGQGGWNQGGWNQGGWNAWGGPPSYHNSGPWGGYDNYHHNQESYDNQQNQQQTSSTTQQSSDTYRSEQTETVNEDEILEDPMIPLDIEKENKEFMEKSEELFIALDGSRWHPLDNVMAKVATKEQ